jgi:ribonucleotide monophosphatase NagD (HAD superfamily)
MAVLTGKYDAVVLDCDGVLYLGKDCVIPGAAATLRALKEHHGQQLFLVTNNSKLDLDTFETKLEGLGLGGLVERDHLWSAVRATTHW